MAILLQVVPAKVALTSNDNIAGNGMAAIPKKCYLECMDITMPEVQKPH